MSKSGISLSFWSIPALGVIQLINGSVTGTYLYNSPGVGVQYLSLFGVNAFASQPFYVSTIGTYTLTFNYASALGSAYNIGNPLKKYKRVYYNSAFGYNKHLAELHY